MLLSPKASVSSPSVQAYPETKLCLCSLSGTYGTTSHVLHEAGLSQRQNENIKTPGVKPERKLKQEGNVTLETGQNCKAERCGSKIWSNSNQEFGSGSSVIEMK